MIYIAIFVYLIVLAFLYDFCGYRKRRKLHLLISLCMLVLVAGLRYRIGSDTVVYMDDFKYYPVLSGLQWNDFTDTRHDPLWILLNVCCKTLCNDFTIVQCVVSLVHISLMTKFWKKVCPSFLFSVLLFYYMFEYLKMNMEVMREAIALPLVLIALLALSERRGWKAVLLVITAAMFHRWSAVVFVLFWCFYRLFTFSRSVAMCIVTFFMLMAVAERNWIYSLTENLTQFDSPYTRSIAFYSTTEKYMMQDLNWKGILSLFGSAVAYLLMNASCRGDYGKYLRIDVRIFESVILFSIILINLKYSFQIFYRFYDYFQTFTSLLAIIWFARLTNKTYAYRKRLVLYVFCMVIPVFYTVKSLTVYFADNPTDSKRLSIYYPYYSVLDPKEDRKREFSIFNYKE